MKDQKKGQVLIVNSLPNMERDLNKEREFYYQKNKMVDAPRLMRKLALMLPQYQLLTGYCEIQDEVYQILLLCLKEDVTSLNSLKSKAEWKQFYKDFCYYEKKELLTFHDCRTPDSPITSSNLNWYQFSTQTGILGYCYQNESPLSMELQKNIVQNKIKVLS